MKNVKFKTVDDYFESVPPEKRDKLKQLRNCIKKAIPEAKEHISYNMPAYKFDKVLVYFASFENHIGFYPTPSAIQAFKERLSEYKFAKGSVQFPHSGDIPVQLVTDICRFRLNEVKQSL